MKTKLFPLFLAFTISVGIMHAEKVKIGDLYYNLNTTDLTAEVTNPCSSCSYAFSSTNIPSSVDYNNRTYSVTSIGSEAFSYCSDLLSVNIPNSVTNIRDKAFRDCYRLTSVIIPSSVADIGNGAFSLCSGLTSLTFGGSVISIGNEAFSGCSGLTSVEIPNSVTNIGDKAFSSCSSLISVEVPNSVTSIGSDAFDGCSELTREIIFDIDAWCNISFDNKLSNPLYYANHLYLNNSEITNLIISNSVTKIGRYAFLHCSGLNSVNIPSSVVSIGNGAFQYCSVLSSITIENGLMAIGDMAFYSCRSLSSVTIPNSVTSIGNEAFSGCSGLTSVNISDIASWCNTSFANESSNPLYHAHNLYLNGDLITDLVIPENVTSIGHNAFYGCTCLTSVNIPTSVTNIGKSAFQGCSRMMKITFGTGVETIGNNAFRQCPYILEIHAPMDLPPVIDASVFAECGDLGGINCYVSEESLALYKKVDVWKSFNLITESAPKAVENVAAEQLRSSTKLLHDGQILILRADRTYTLTGQEVK